MTLPFFRQSFFPAFLQRPLDLLRRIPLFQKFEESVFTSYVSDGKFVGQDAHGNKYFERSQPSSVHCRERYVIYANFDFDASQIPPNWHSWLHKTTDVIPKPIPNAASPDMSKIRSNPDAVVLSTFERDLPDAEFYIKSKAYRGIRSLDENLTGTAGKYVPYSTTVPKVQRWDKIIS